MDETLRKQIEKLLVGQSTRDERRTLRELLERGALDDFFDREAERFLKNDTLDDMAGLTPEKHSEILEYIRNYEQSVIPISRPVWRRPWVVAAAAIAIFVVSGIGYYRSTYLQSDFVSEKTAPRTFTGRSYVQIPDGSTALLDEGSTLTVLPGFGDGTREVMLEGRAYFDVEHDPSRPFIVRTGQIVTTVLGTAFLVDTDSQKNQITITVTRGKVAVGDGKTVYDQLTPDEQLVVNTADLKFEKRNVNSEELDDWKTSYLILDDVTMERAAELIGERFNVDVSIENEDVRRCVVSVWFVNNEDLDAVMTVLSKLRQATYTINGRKVSVIGGTGCTSRVEGL